jgi:hypothetical protein
MPQMQTLGDQGIQTNAGGSMQAFVPVSVHALPATVAASGNVTSNLIFSDGMKTAAIGVTSSQTGNITVQRYLDDAGTIKQGAALTAALNITDGNPFASFTVNISNTGGSTANLTNVGILLQG